MQDSILPDPTADLDWSGYVGSIQSIFAKNAEEHPERICVVETESLDSPERSFTYRQIYEASNILAHYLHGAGISNGDVVMLWAHRSVDLVIGIMGTLASGATMTVLDPAYPPERQRVYLQVSQPRALINLTRATAEAGQLSTIVRHYIETDMKLKAEIPSLRIDDSGRLLGTDHGVEDIFAGVRARAASAPEVIVGPDSNPTLSFTSGSEGLPKGVLGRHYSLAYYFGWMAEKFGLTSESKFTMLSGIAHDPIQRDIFTPLFLGAQLLVPSKEDIQQEKLAEWMRQYKPTVTHLTPAMGHVLVGGATAKFPSLENAFFVGDVLTKRDCKSLRALAPNTTIINMLGTTETQRAVSYYQIPSHNKDQHFLDEMQDMIPAGKGMKNVQLLIVNREDRTKMCQIGEEGEIYFRAAGLAEGYMGDPAMTDSKFIPNWFVDNKTWVEKDKENAKSEPWRKYYKGPRDRLYRTGDVGKYLTTGDVECTGRADDQVKIRGYRIELNEIDGHLTHFALIRSSKTFVRRDRNEEPHLISYIVPELAEWRSWLKARKVEYIIDEGTDFGKVKVYKKGFGLMQTEAREHLKGRLISQAVPTFFIVVDELPLNPNKKVDKQSLPPPDFAEQTEKATEEDLARWESMSQTEQLVATRWARLVPGLNEKIVKPQDSFFDLGGHSLLAQQMLLDIRKQLSINISITDLYESPTLAGFSAKLDQHKETSNGPSQKKAKIDGTTLYEKSFNDLVKQLPDHFPSMDATKIRQLSNATVFLTGATGFLGAYLIKDILQRSNPNLKLIVHVRNVTDPAAGLKRLQGSLESYGLWQTHWAQRLTCVVGDLAQPRLGLGQAEWDQLSMTADAVIHNGATVHWVKTYQGLMASNVVSTLDALRLCSEGRPKTFTFVSSTSVLDTDHYIQLSDKQISTGQHAITEEDDLMGSRSGLGTGYGQTKWVSEQLVRRAGLNGLVGSIVRPGYILADSTTGVCNTDDFLIRMLKGCIQLSKRPRIINTVNAVPVNHVARVVVAAALNPLPNGTHVIHVTGHPRLRMHEYLSSLEYYGFAIPEIPYNAWKDKLEEYVSAGGPNKDLEQHALMPLFHFCVNDLPANTRAPELDDSNAVSILKADAEHWTGVDESAGYGVTREDMGRTLSYLTKIKFIELPTMRTGRPLPDIDVDVAHMQAAGGAGGRGGSKK